MKNEHFSDAINPDAGNIPSRYESLTESWYCWGHTVAIPANSFYRSGPHSSWNFTDTAFTTYVCCSGDYYEVVETNPCLRTIYSVE